MGLEIPKEFYPITPIRTDPNSRTRPTTPPSSAKRLLVAKADDDDDHQSNRICGEDDRVVGDLAVKSSGPVVVVLDDEECRTPTSEEYLLKPSLVCPPAPKKPLRVADKRKSPPSRRETFLGAPINDADLESVFVLLGCNGPQSKKIKAGRVHHQS